MDDPSKTFAPELSPAGSRQWIGRLLIAVVLGAAIWNFVVALTSSVVVPALARIMEADPQSPLYLGKGDFNVPAIFASVLELCFALIVALMVNAWSGRRVRVVRRKSPSAAPAVTSILSTPSAVPSRSTPAVSLSTQPVRQAPESVPAPIAAPPTIAAPEQTAAQPPEVPAPVAQPTPVAKAAKPEKPKPPKKVYYNLVGEPMESDDE